MLMESYKDLESENLRERYTLAYDRVKEMMQEQTVPAPFDSYFQKTAEFLLFLKDVYASLQSGAMDESTLEEWQELNLKLYEDVLPDRYQESFGNPAYAEKVLGEEYGRMLSFLYTELRGLIGYVFEGWLEAIVVHLELFIEVYNCFENPAPPDSHEVQQILYWFVSDYCDVFVTEHIRESVDPARDFAVRIIEDSDLSDLRYLYRYGEYVTENELQTAAFLNSLEESEIQAMADTFTEGYRMGFVKAGIDLSKKLTVNIRYHIGFERLIRAAIANFQKLGLRPVIYRHALSAANKRMGLRIGYTGKDPNPQFDFDHREDCALYLDKKYAERYLGVQRTAFETFRTLANGHAGPAVIEEFGEEPFTPEAKPQAYALSPKQRELLVSLNNESALITNRYIPGDERSFTIISFPMPEIGPRFAEIFRETLRVNTLDYRLYERIQQVIIDALDKGNEVHVKGKNGNLTDLTVALHPLSDPEKESNFENCVADVNIPVGEVFTSPLLAGTNGVLHVKEVYLGNLKYVDLSLTFRDGKIADYRCANFDTAEENEAFIRSNLLYHHETLPLGEFAIGTNTTAYVMGKKFDIGGKLPILIAEKTGPHFAVGDTCYCRSEDLPVHNPDGKEIIARDNEISILRKEDPGKAYFGCHTDITIPYEELGLLSVTGADGYCAAIIRDGRFVLKGTEELNLPLQAFEKEQSFACQGD